MILKNIKQWGILLLIAPLLTLSCSEDFLDTELEGAETEEVYYSTASGLAQMVVGAYSTINTTPRDRMNMDVMYLAYGSFSSDEAEAGGEAGGNDKLDFQYWDQGNPLPIEDESISRDHWGYCYKTIARANQTLKGIDFYRENTANITTDTAALLSRFEGEMKFLRAFTHFRLTQIYGGVPIIDHILSSEEFDVTRNTVAECLHFIQKDLREAADLLPEKSEYAAFDMGRATKGAALSLLGKAYLYESSYAENYAGDVRFGDCAVKYDSALMYLEMVINSGEYQLVGENGETFDTYWNQNESPLYTETPGYRYIHSVDGDNSPESIFETQAINDGESNYMVTRGTYLTIYTTVRFTNESSSQLGWSFNCPTPELLEAYEDGDPRKIVTIGEDGDPIWANEEWQTMDCGITPTHMLGRKYECSAEQFWGDYGSDGNSPKNFPYIRFGDVVLMAAEAAFKSNDQATALTYVNRVRRRARNDDMSAVPADLSSVDFDAIVNERLFELALEGHRFFDLVRWNMAKDILPGQPLQRWLNGKEQPSPIANDFTVGVNEFWPIPADEVNATNGSLVQYQGYR